MAYVIFSRKHIEISGVIDNFGSWSFVIKQLIVSLGIRNSFSPIIGRDDTDFFYVSISKQAMYFTLAIC